MTKDSVEAFGSLADALAKIMHGNAGGFVITWLLVIALVVALVWLVRRFVRSLDERFNQLHDQLVACQKQHTECQTEKRQLAQALIDLAAGKRWEAQARAMAILEAGAENIIMTSRPDEREPRAA